ncbi:transcription factor Spi-C [Hippoglossus stenolepis]|uniref:transcription factor Spi-C n=1 Tax=Hippoglossus stenolepis TaxID=195615 RepID=UPI001FAE8436|nr:transcription factor Spi-C [Hippoglossus stenolepis]
MTYLYQNSLQDAQSDLEVILEFLEEYYRQNSAENEDKVHHSEAAEERSAPVDEASYEQLWTYYHQTYTSAVPGTRRPSSPRPKHGSKKIRLFHFLFEMLEDPSMAHCVSWVPAAAGVFRFSSKNKNQVAVLWGQRKGNKRPMTYQKMSRALRNYARSGEIFKVKKKLTYQFSLDTLMLLQRCRRGDV